MMPFRLMLLLITLSHFCSAQSCLSGGVTFSNQDEIDDFSTLYPNCTIIEGDVQIGDFDFPFNGTDIVDLSGLSSISQINGSVNIFYNSQLQDLLGLSNLNSIAGDLSIDNNDSLVNLSGFENLTTVNGNLTIKSNEGLISLTGLDNITHISNSLFISTNPELTSFNGMGNVVSIGGYFSIANNEGLVNFQGLGSLNTIGNFVDIWNNESLNTLIGLGSLSNIDGFVTISNNDNLGDLNGLSSLLQIEGGLSIHDNSNLTSIDGIQNIDPESISALFPSQNDIEIFNNTILASCAIENVCMVYNTPNSKIMIYDNGEDCESISDVNDVCNPQCAVVSNTLSSGPGSLPYCMECVSQNDTIFIDEVLDQDTIWLSVTTLDVEKSFVLKGPPNRLMIASTLEAPLVKNHINEQIHLINVDLYKFYPVAGHAIFNEGNLILENCDIYVGPHEVYQSNTSNLEVRGEVRLLGQ